MPSPSMTNELEQRPDLDDEEEEAVDLREVVGMLRKAPRRRPRLTFLTFLVVAVLGILGAIFWPRTYEADVRILAQRNLVLPALGNPSRAVPREADSPTRNVPEQILARDNLVSLIKQANLVDLWDQQRPPILRLKDRVTGLLGGPISDEDKMRALVGLLEKRINVAADDTTVTITVDWSNADMAYQLVSLVEKNFLDARHAAEVAIISDAIAILEGHANEEREEIDAALAELQRLRDERMRQLAKSAPPPTAGQPSAPSRPMNVSSTPAPDAELKQMLEEKRRQIRDVEQSRQRQIDDLKRQLGEMRTTYAPAHPMIISREKQLEELSEDPPELNQLKNEERTLLVQIANANEGRPVVQRPAAPFAAPPPQSGPAVPFSTENQVGRPSQASDDDAATALAKAKLTNATRKYEEFMSRIDAARIELDTARAAFKYRYSVIRPPEVPKKPRKPNPPLLAVGGVIGGLFLGIGLAFLADMASGIFLEGWQVRRKLRLPLLGEVSRP